MINLYEYQNKVAFPEKDLDDVELFLEDIWNNREKSEFYYGLKNDDEGKIEEQRFIQILRKRSELKSNNYVGVIHFENKKINLLPKIFYDGKEPDKNRLKNIQLHILWWLSYCRKIKFPSYDSGLSQLDSDFFEVMIYLFTRYTRSLLSSSIYQQYQEIDRELTFVKGRINNNRYINDNLATGRWHRVSCTYDSFEMDNTFNRVIKYVSSLLIGVSSNVENQQRLREILFILDEVSDQVMTSRDCRGLVFNPMMSDFETVRDYCQMFLDHSISYDYKKDLKLFAFLLPMEYVFEDFVFGFIEKEIDEVNAKAQVSSIFLDTNHSFKLKPDLLLQVGDKKILADTKYKMVYADPSDPKKGISQNDLYQMVSYAIRFKINEMILFYPNTINNAHGQIGEVIIEDELADKEEIIIRSYQLPIIDYSILQCEIVEHTNLDILFKQTKQRLMKEIKTKILSEISIFKD